MISRVTNDTEVIRDLYVTVWQLSCVAPHWWARCWWRCSARLANGAGGDNDFPGGAGGNVIYQRYSTPIVRRVRAYLADSTTALTKSSMA